MKANGTDCRFGQIQYFYLCVLQAPIVLIALNECRLLNHRYRLQCLLKLYIRLYFGFRYLECLEFLVTQFRLNSRLIWIPQAFDFFSRRPDSFWIGSILLKILVFIPSTVRAFSFGALNLAYGNFGP